MSATALPEAPSAALQAVLLAPADARGAQRLAERVLGAAPDAREASLAQRALGLAAVELGRAEDAVRHLRRAVAIADRAGLTDVAAEARMSLSLALGLRGRTRSALDEAERAAGALGGVEQARALCQRALLLQRAGRTDEALDGYRRALSGLRRHGDALWEARLRCNRGVLHAYRGALGAAQEDLVCAEALHERLGNQLAAAQVRHNRGWLAARSGDVPAALAMFDQVDAEYRALGVTRASLLMDRCEVLAHARLLPEARAAAREAVAELAAGHCHADLAEARLLLAHAALEAGDPAEARAEAERAQHAFARQGRGAWAALARHLALRARWRAGERTLAAARRDADALASAGWTVAALEARLVAGRTALALGRTAEAERDLAAAAAARRRGPVDLRIRAWHAEALLRLARDDPRGASAAVHAGLRALEDHQSTLGASELRAHAAEHGDELAALGVRLALRTGQPDRVLAAAERCRATALRAPAVRPPDDAAVADALAELRGVTAEVAEAVAEGHHPGPLLHRQAAVEARVRHLSLHARGAERPVRARGSGRSLDRELHGALGDRALVELVVCGGRLHAVVLAGGRTHLGELGEVEEALRALDRLRFGLRRLATRHGTERSLAAHREATRSAAARLDAAILAPLAAETGDRPLVVVPTGELHATPWALLPSCAGRPVSVAPSAALWLRAATAPARGASGVALVAGPDLPGGAEEVEALRLTYPAATALTGADATASRVSAALTTAGTAHVAAHGVFRADNPNFSALRLADGPLTVYDLEALPRVPERLVLSACDSGRSAVRTGDELMGLGGTLLGLGTRTLIASVMLVPDAETRDLMLALHAHLRDGRSPADALARAQESVPWAAFACLGDG